MLDDLTWLEYAAVQASEEATCEVLVGLMVLLHIIEEVEHPLIVLLKDGKHEAVLETLRHLLVVRVALERLGDSEPVALVDVTCRHDVDVLTERDMRTESIDQEDELFYCSDPLTDYLLKAGLFLQSPNVTSNQGEDQDSDEL